MGKTNFEQRPKMLIYANWQNLRMVDAIFFLPPKEAQGKVRQSQGRAVANNFAHRDPLDHLSVKDIFFKQ